ncbi:MAG: Crp/Fnr family transcriptional regulator [Mucilaginibacter polytrichastri]|nr:Crp/Fnr family transcriptional regulator [Mucilaginibacter polytrichastri]
MQAQLRQHIEKIVPLSDEEFAFVLGHFSRRSYKKEAYMVSREEPVRYNFFVLSGLMKLVYHDRNAKEHIVSFAMEDWWETDFGAWYTRSPASFSLQCLEDTEVYCLSLENHHALCAGLPRMEHFFFEKAALGHIASQQRILSFLMSGAEERYEQLLKRQPRLLQRVPKRLLAAYLGVSRETLSRLGRG